MAEAIAVISFVSAIAGLVDISSKVVKRLNDFQSKAHDIPQTFQHVKTVLPITIQGLEQTRVKAQTGTMDSETQKALVPALEGCGSQVRRIHEILEKVLPKNEDSSWDKTKKALRSLSNDKEVQEILKDLDRYVLNFTFHTTSSAGTVMPQSMPMQRIIMIPAKRDPNFVDRTDILREVESNLKVYGRAAIAGIGGVGKTQIAIEQRYRFLSDCPMVNVFWAHAGTLSDFVEACKTVAGELQLPGWNDPKVDILHLLHQWLSNGQNSNWLFVLDNADDIEILDERLPSQSFPAGISQFFPQKARGAILVTTRDKRIGERMGVRGRTTMVPAMKMSEGRQLFSAYLPAVLDDRTDSVEQLVDALEHLPLAITQAAAYITENDMRVEDYLSILQEESEDVLKLLGESLSDDRRGYPESNSVTKTWKLSFDRITKQDPRAADILSLMAVFDHQGIPATLLKHVDESKMVFTKSMSTLRNFSLVAKAADGETYSMHRLVQISAQAWLELQNTTFRWRREALFTLAKLFPSGDYDTWRACEPLLPHTRVLLQHELQPSDCVMKRAELLQKLAWFDRCQGRYNSALSKAQEASKIFERLQGKDTPMVLSSMTTIGDCLIEQYKFQEAECILQKSRTLQEQTLGSSNPETLRSMGNLALVWLNQERYDEAESLFRETLTGRQQTLGSNHPDTLLSLNNMSVLLYHKGSFGEAEKLCKASLELRLQLRGPDHPDFLESQEMLAGLLHSRGDYENAEQQFRVVLDSLKKVSGILHPRMLPLMFKVAICVGAQGKHEEAIQLYRVALNFGEKALGSEHRDLIFTRYNLAEELTVLGSHKEAMHHLQIMLASRGNYPGSFDPLVNRFMSDAQAILDSLENRYSDSG